MFDFERLDVYQHVKEQNIKVLQFLEENSSIDPYLSDQWRQASLRIVTSLAESTGKMTGNEKKQSLAEARGNVFISVAILEAVRGMGRISEGPYQDLYEGYEKASKMLLGMVRSFSKDREVRNGE